VRKEWEIKELHEEKLRLGSWELKGTKIPSEVKRSVRREFTTHDSMELLTCQVILLLSIVRTSSPSTFERAFTMILCLIKR
jgi:hypothetical protein